MNSRIAALVTIVATLAVGISHSHSEQASVAVSGEQVRTFTNNVATDHRPGNGITPELKQTEADNESVERVNFSDPASGRTISSAGDIVGEQYSNASRASSDAFVKGTQGAELSSAAASGERVTIDSMTFGVTYSQTYSPGNGLVLFGPAKTYYLSDGSSWQSGAGSYSTARALLDRVELSGTTIRYYFEPPVDGFVYRQTDYNSGDHSSNGSLGIVGPIVLETTLGSSSAVIKGEVEILTNLPANYPEPRFNFWSAPAGAIAPFEATFTLIEGAGFSETTFDTQQKLANEGTVNFAESRRPPLSKLEISGPRQVPFGSTVSFFATALYEGNGREDVTAVVPWSVSPDDVASIESGILTIAQSGCAGSDIELSASYTLDGETRDDSISIQCVDPAVGGLDDSWETYQGDERHTGYVPISLEPSSFTLQWKRQIASGRTLNPVTAADGKVFVSAKLRFTEGKGLFVLDSRDGQTLWSKDFGSVNSVNPPAYGYGNVYIQTGDHSDNTHLWAFDADTGEQSFKVPHSAQWESYYAPTIYEGEVYVNGGYYGGMYAFNAFTGSSNWFVDLPQYDEYTPAVDDNYTYAYVGEYAPALYVIDRQTGKEAFRIADPNFDWRGWSMDLAPVLGAQNDVLVIHNNRLIKFDLEARRIAFELTDGFVGQPSVAKQVIYAINNGGVEARGETDGALLWRWAPEAGNATEHVIVTDTHVLAHTETHTFAIDVLSGVEDWSYPEAGSMALGNDALYIVTGDSVVAISMPGFIPSPVERLEIVGPTYVTEFSEVEYTAQAYYEDGRIRDRTVVSEWELLPAVSARLDESGLLSVGELPVPSELVEIRATYREDDVVVTASQAVTLAIGTSEDEFIYRNLRAANNAKSAAIAALQEAARREQAAIDVLQRQIQVYRNREPATRKSLKRLKKALSYTDDAKSAAERSKSITERETD